MVVLGKWKIFQVVVLFFPPRWEMDLKVGPGLCLVLAIGSRRDRAIVSHVNFDPNCFKNVIMGGFQYLSFDLHSSPSIDYNSEILNKNDIQYHFIGHCRISYKKTYE